MIASNDVKARVVFLYVQKIKRASEIREAYGIPERTLRRWARAYRRGGIDALQSKKRGPRHRPPNSITSRLERRILVLKQRHPSWGARRIKFQYDLSCSWRTVHAIIKRHHMLVRVKAKPQNRRSGSRGSMWTRCGRATRSSSA